MKNWSLYLNDPLTGRRYLPKGYFWIGGENNVEDFFKLDTIERNCRDLKARLLLLRQEVSYVLNSRILLPTGNKYAPRAQALDKLEPCILRHNNGVVKPAVAGIHYVDYASFQMGKLCMIRSDVSNENNKFIAETDITPIDIHEHFEEYNEYKIETNITINEIKNDITNITNEIRNINTDITNINTTLNNHITEISNINNNITNINNEINKHETNITNINNDIDNIETTITNLNQQIQNIDDSVTNIENTITNEINVDIGDFKVQLETQLNMINNLIVQVNGLITAIANINNLIIGLQNQIDAVQTANCIAWAMGNDQLLCII